MNLNPFRTALAGENLWPLRIIAALLALALIGLILFGADRYSTGRFNRKIASDKAEVANTVDQIHKVDGEIQNLQGQKEQLKKTLDVQAQELANTLAVGEVQKRETNQALANYNTALRTNTNVDATAEDLQRVLDKLKAGDDQ